MSYRPFRQNTVSKTTTYTATSQDDVILCSASGGAWSLSLPAAASNTGKVFKIVRTDSTTANLLTIDPNGTETIAGATTRTIGTQYDYLVIVSDGSNWQIIDDGITVAARYESSAGQSITNGSDVIIDFGTKIYDTHAAVTTGASWKFTAPVAGLYRVSSALHWALGTYTLAGIESLRLYKNGSIHTFVSLFGNAATGSYYATNNGTATLQLAAGDYIDLRARHIEGSARSLHTDPQTVHIEIERVGN